MPVPALNKPRTLVEKLAILVVSTVDNLLLKVVQSVLERKPLCEALACFTCKDVPLPITAPVPPVMVKTEEPVSVRLPVVIGVAKVDMGSFRTSPLVMVSKLSALVLVPCCTPLSVKGFVPATCNLVEGAVVPIPTLPCTSKPLAGAALAR